MQHGQILVSLKTVLLMLLPIFKLDTVSFLLWPAILLVDLIAIGLAVLSFSLAAVAAVLVLTLVATGLCIFKVPVAVVFAPSLLLVIGGFAVFCGMSGATYIINDVVDAERDRKHPRKCKRPIASGAVPVGTALVFALLLLADEGRDLAVYLAMLHHRGHILQLVPSLLQVESVAPNKP